MRWLLFCSRRLRLCTLGFLAGIALLATACRRDARTPSDVSPAFFCAIPNSDATTIELTEEGTPSMATNPWPPCDLGIYGEDVTIPDGTAMVPGETFVKTWRISNGGTCTWTPDYWFAFAGGDQMGGPNAIALTDRPVAPGEAIEISVTLTAPQQTGKYKGEWTLCNAQKEAFGFGHGMGQLLNIWVSIEVARPTRQP